MRLEHNPAGSNSTLQTLLRTGAAAKKRGWSQVAALHGARARAHYLQLTGLEVDALVAVWNRVVKRVPAPFLNCDRVAKGNDLRTLGAAYGKAFTIAFGAAAHTHYTHYIAHHLHEQVRKVHEIMDYSGQAGEHFGKKQKQRAQLTGKGGGGKKGEGGSSYLKQLGKWEVIREAAAH